MQQTAQKALLINGYQTFPGVGQATLNSSLIEATKALLEAKGYEVQITQVEQGFDPMQEHQKLLWADVIYLQTPIYWFSIPGAFKSYIDQVLMMGYADGSTLSGDGRTRSDASKKYGSGGKLQAKKYMLCSTWNSPTEAFDDPEQFFEGLSVDQVLMPLHKSYQFLGLQKMPSFTFYDVFKNPEEVAGQVEAFKNHIQKNF
jgi:modulator of drug activity B